MSTRGVCPTRPEVELPHIALSHCQSSLPAVSAQDRGSRRRERKAGAQGERIDGDWEGGEARIEDKGMTH
jgi:hypothetical protein